MTAEERAGTLLHRIRAVTFLAASVGLVALLWSGAPRRAGLVVVAVSVLAFVAAGVPLRRIRKRHWQQWIERSPIPDDLLGDLRPFEDEIGVWVASIPRPGHKATLQLNGDEDGPDAGTVEHGREIVRSWATFEARMAAFLASEAERMSDPDYRPEIGGLTIQTICLGGRSGMIWFDGGLASRTWRCDYVDGEPTSLGFDS